MATTATVPRSSASESEMRFRETTETDVPELFAVRVATRENALSRDQLAGLGINEESVSAMLRTTHRGWLCEEGDRVVGFAMGNRESGEMWVIALLPDYEGRRPGAVGRDPSAGSRRGQRRPERPSYDRMVRAWGRPGALRAGSSSSSSSSSPSKCRRANDCVSRTRACNA